MKKKSLLSLSIIMAAVLVTLLSTSTITAKNNKLNANRETGAQVDYDIAKNKETLKADRQKQKDSRTEVVLDVAWGEGEENLKMSVYQEAPDTPVSYTTPSSYAVDDNGNIYVCDTLSNKIKVFNNNQLIRSIELPTDRLIVLRDIDVDAEGVIYGTNYPCDEVIRIGSDNIAASIFRESGINRPETIDVLCSGNIMLQDNEDSNNTTKVRKFDKNGRILSEKKMANMIDYSLYDYESSNGDIISLAPIGPGVHQIELKNKNKNNIGTCNFSHEAVENDMICNSDLLGADSEGRIYFRIVDAPLISKQQEMGIENYFNQSKEYISRVDSVKNITDSIRIENTDRAMSNSTANLSNNIIKMDNSGNVYQLQMNEQGYRIIRYSFQ